VITIIRLKVITLTVAAQHKLVQIKSKTSSWNVDITFESRYRGSELFSFQLWVNNPRCRCCRLFSRSLLSLKWFGVGKKEQRFRGYFLSACMNKIANSSCWKKQCVLQRFHTRNSNLWLRVRYWLHFFASHSVS